MFRDWRKTEKGFFDEFEKEIEQMNEIMNHMMTSLEKSRMSMVSAFRSILPAYRM